MVPRQDKKIFRFGVFEVDASSGELRKSGVRLRLQEQPFQVLLLMLERPGEVVSREELRQKLWPADTFVDFDHSLNTIVNKLREVLGDSASNPRFIETLAKRGYRFLAPVESVDHRDSVSADPTEQMLRGHQPPLICPSDGVPSQPTSLLTRIEEVPAVPHGHVRLLFILIQAMYLAFYVAALARLSHVQDLLDQMFSHPAWLTTILIISAAVGIPIRLYLLSAVAFDVAGISRKFLRLFPATFVLDELWALAPFLLTGRIGLGLALGATAALIYVPFAQRTLLLMRDRSPAA
jgi:cholera toxin transcriptional activator